jgi:DNA (cytosine-5)-methyltransferase 1
LNPKAISQKISRLGKGGQLRVLDLFSGCGGLSLGFHAAGFHIAAAVEFDAHAAASHGQNFHDKAPAHGVARDITKTSPQQLCDDLGLGVANVAFDVIVGGPPCQAFARVGRSKLREVAEHPEAFRHDPRARLYIEYLDFVEQCAPLAVVMENVPDMLNHGGRNIANEVCEVLAQKGYICSYTLLNAAFYGVPQMRERMFLVAVRKEIGQRVTFPEPSHWIDLPPGYDGTRAVALKLISSEEAIGTTAFYQAAPKGHNGLPPAVTAEEALRDLPLIDARAELNSGLLKRGARRFDLPIAWGGEPHLGEYGKLMRTWPGFEGKPGLADHVIRYLPRDYALFARLQPGEQYPEAHQRALQMFEERLTELGRSDAGRPKNGSAAWKKLKAAIVPPYDPGKFPNKWRKMEPNKPSRTLLAHLGKDSYTHIHYDSEQARTISVREAARLQSFPDGFVFRGTMNPAFKQIGNAVPPLLAKAVATSLSEVLAIEQFKSRQVA